jgi:anti-anti-sigma regulatory factor
MGIPYHAVHFQGILDISRYPEFRTEFEELPRAVPVLVDLTGVEAVDSVFLSEMMLAKRRHEAPFAIVLAPLSSVARVFEHTGLDQRPYVFGDASKAVESLSAPPETTAE